MRSLKQLAAERVAWTLLALGLAGGCEVDDRVLHREAAGSAGTNASSGGRGGSNTSGGAAAAGSGHGGSSPSGGGSAASAGSANPDPGAGGEGAVGGAGGAGSGAEPCPDLDANSVLDCEQSLLEDSTFDVGTEGWAAEADAEIAWNAVDARSKPSSGSMFVRNAQTGEGSTLGMVGAAHCIKVAAGEKYALYAQCYVQADALGVFAGATAWFYAEPDCQGSLLDAATSPLQGALNAWKVLRLRPIVVPEQAVSMLVRLAAAKELAAEPLSVYFDNVLLTQ